MNNLHPDKAPGVWDFAEVPATTLARHETFSVGIFQWYENRRSRLKRGMVVSRVRGSTDDPQAVYELAAKIVASLNRGTLKPHLVQKTYQAERSEE